MITLRKRASEATTLAYCREQDFVGQAVRIVGVEMGVVSVTPVDPSRPEQMPAYGLIAEKLSATRCLVRRWGDVKLPTDTALEPGKVCYVGPGATLTTTQPDPVTSPTGVYVLQAAGHATGPSTVDFSPSPNTLEVSV